MSEFLDADIDSFFRKKFQQRCIWLTYNKTKIQYAAEARLQYHYESKLLRYTDCQFRDHFCKAREESEKLKTMCPLLRNCKKFQENLTIALLSPHRLLVYFSFSQAFECLQQLCDTLPCRASYENKSLVQWR